MVELMSVGLSKGQWVVFGQWVTQRLADLGLNRNDARERAGSAFSYSWLQEIERGGRPNVVPKPQAKTWAGLAKALDLTVQQLNGVAEDIKAGKKPRRFAPNPGDPDDRLSRLEGAQRKQHDLLAELQQQVAELREARSGGDQ